MIFKAFKIVKKSIFQTSEKKPMGWEQIFTMMHQQKTVSKIYKINMCLIKNKQQNSSRRPK